MASLKSKKQTKLPDSIVSLTANKGQRHGAHRVADDMLQHIKDEHGVENLWALQPQVMLETSAIGSESYPDGRILDRSTKTSVKYESQESSLSHDYEALPDEPEHEPSQEIVSAAYEISRKQFIEMGQEYDRKHLQEARDVEWIEPLFPQRRDLSPEELHGRQYRHASVLMDPEEREDAEVDVQKDLSVRPKHLYNPYWVVEQSLFRGAVPGESEDGDGGAEFALGDFANNSVMDVHREVPSPEVPLHLRTTGGQYQTRGWESSVDWNSRGVQGAGLDVSEELFYHGAFGVSPDPDRMMTGVRVGDGTFMHPIPLPRPSQNAERRVQDFEVGGLSSQPRSLGHYLEPTMPTFENLPLNSYYHGQSSVGFPSSSYPNIDYDSTPRLSPDRYGRFGGYDSLRPTRFNQSFGMDNDAQRSAATPIGQWWYDTSMPSNIVPQKRDRSQSGPHHTRKLRREVS